MANDHQIAKSIINKAVLWVEDVLGESTDFKLKDLKEPFKPNEEAAVKIVVIDVEEQPIERPKYNQESSYSGEKNDTQQISSLSECSKYGSVGHLQRYGDSA